MADIVIINPKFEMSFWGLEACLPFLGKRSNMPVAAARAAKAIRAHWGIETTSNYSRDVTFAEDRSRIRTNPGVFARLRSFGYNILKANRTDTLSQDRYRAALAGIKKLGSLVAIS